MSEIVRTGVVGTGGLGTALGRRIHESDHGQVVAVADVSAENRNRAADELGVPEDARYEEYESLLEDDIDAVVIATPHTLHYEQVVAALDRGLHVLCEKPLTTDLDHARELVRLAETGEEVLMVGYQRHVSPAYVAAAEWIDSHARPKFITAEITQNWITAQIGQWRSNPDLSGGGQLYDTGSHLVDAVLWTTGLTPTHVSAEMVFHDDERRVDTQAMVNVGFEGGTVASISVSGDAPRVREHIHFWGDDGAIYIDGVEWNQRELTEIDLEGEERTRSLADPPFANKCEAFLHSILTGVEPPATARDAFYVTAVTEAAYESARTGERVPIEL